MSRLAIFLGVFLTLSADSARFQQAQSAVTGAIRGIVFDSGGGVIPGVRLSVMPRTASAVVSTTVTRQDGTFETSELPSGVYRVDLFLEGFELIRVNNVRIGDANPDLRIVLRVSPVCQCVIVPPPRGPLVETAGQVLDEAKQPIPHARLEIVSEFRETALTDAEGRFRVRLKKDVNWPLSVTATGFQALQLNVSARSSSPIRVTLKTDRQANVPSIEQLTRGCECGGVLFTHNWR